MINDRTHLPANEAGITQIITERTEVKIREDLRHPRHLCSIISIDYDS